MLDLKLFKAVASGALAMLLAGCLTVIPVFAQGPVPPNPDKPKKLALVLSGGSQRAWAFVPVLRKLEEMRVPIHHITGTSGGALIGAMYAQGASPDEIEQFLRCISAGMVTNDWVKTGKPNAKGRPTQIRAKENWADLLSNRVPFDHLQLRQKQDRRRYQIGFEIGKNGLSGISYGPMIGLLLSRLSLGHTRGDAFLNNTATFSTLSTNLAVKPTQAIYHTRGSLAVALRSSMAIPAVFAPIPVGEDDVPELRELYDALNTMHETIVYRGLLTDGGVLDVFPVEKTLKRVKAMDPTCDWSVIGASVQPSTLTTDLPKKGFDAGSQSSLTKQLDLSLKAVGAEQIRKNEIAAANEGVLISITKGKGGWADQDAFYDAGRIALGDAENELKSDIYPDFQAKEKEWERYIAARKSLKKRRVFTISDIRVRIIDSRGQATFDSPVARSLAGRLGKFKGAKIQADDLLKPNDTLLQIEDKIAAICGEERYMYALYEHTDAGLLPNATSKRTNDGDRLANPNYKRTDGGLLVTFYEQSIAEPITSLGLNVLTHSGTKSIGLFEFQHSKFDSVRTGSALRYRVTLGDQLNIGATLDIPMQNSTEPKTGFRFEAGYGAFDLDQWSFNQDPDRVARYTDVLASAATGLTLNLARDAEIYAGIGTEHRHRSLDIGHPDTVRGSSTLARGFIVGTLDRTDSASMPLRGSRLSAKYAHIRQWWDPHFGSNETIESQLLQVKGMTMVAVGHNSGVSLFAEGEYGRYSNPVPLYEFRLGGPNRIGSIARDEAFGSRYHYVSVGIRRPMSFGDGMTTRRTDLLAYYEIGKAERQGVRLKENQSVTLGMQIATLLGNVEVGVSTWSEVRKARYFFGLGGRF